MKYYIYSGFMANYTLIAISNLDKTWLYLFKDIMGVDVVIMKSPFLLQLFFFHIISSCLWYGRLELLMESVSV